MLVLYILHPTDVFSQAGDSVQLIGLSDGISTDIASGKQGLLDYPFPFFDVEVTKIYTKVDLSRSHPEDTSRYLILEIKKKSLQQFRLKPIVRKKIRLSANTSYIDSLDLSDSLFASGNYDFIVSSTNDSLKVYDVKKATFQLLRKHNALLKEEFYSFEADKARKTISVEKTFVQKYDIAQLRKNILSLSPLAKGTEQKVIKELALSENPEVMKLFFYNFWYDRNPSDPEKDWNDYVIILNSLAKKYGNASTPGYETDRGRIFIQYGEPDRITKVTNEKNTLPYEVWFYYRSGTKTNLKFLFFQPGMLGNTLLLLHSNIPEEIINPYWKEMLLSDPNNGDNKLMHKVFEFFN